MKIDKYVSGQRERAPRTAMANMLIFGITALVIAAALRIFVSINIVRDDSMEPTLKKGSIVILARFASVTPGAVVCVRNPDNADETVFSRVAARAGQTVAVENKRVLVNGAAWTPAGAVRKDSRIFPAAVSARDIMAPITVPANAWFVIGDNFDRAFDSRYFGPVTDAHVAGVLLFHIR